MYLQKQSGSQDQITIFWEIPTNQNVYSSRVHWKFLNYEVLAGYNSFFNMLLNIYSIPNKLEHKAHTGKFKQFISVKVIIRPM